MKLQIQSGQNAGQTFQLVAGTTTIGRSAENNIALNDPTVSRRHARIDQQGNAFVISDLGSTSGTWLNGNRLTSPQWLREGDTIMFGQTSAIAQSSEVIQMAPMQPTAYAAPQPAAQNSSPILILTLIGVLVGLGVFVLLLIFALRGPASSSQVAAVPATATLAPSGTATPTMTALPTRTALATSTPQPTVTPSATPTWTPTPTSTLPPTPTATPRRLNTGTFIKETMPRDGEGEFTVENGQDYDAVVAMTTLDNVPVFSVYIQRQQSYTVTGVRDGTYRVYFSQGEDWDSALARFTRNARFVRFQDTFPYLTTATTAKTWKITLYTVVGGTATTETLDPGQFPDLK